MATRILDLGCGTGGYVEYLHRLDREAEIHGIDISAENIAACERARTSEKLHFQVAAGEKIPSADGYFHAVHCYEVLEHVSDLAAALKEIRRVLMPAGKLTLSVPVAESESILSGLNPGYLDQIGHKRVFTREALQRSLIDAGFVLEKHQQYDAIEHLFWVHIFKRGGVITNQIGDTTVVPSLWFRVLHVFLAKGELRQYLVGKNVFYKIGAILGLPLSLLGRLLDRFAICKRQKAVCRTV